MQVTCTNEQCQNEFNINNVDLEVESNKSGTHTTQYSISGTIYCPNCNNEMEINYLSDKLDDTGEILSSEIIHLS